MGIEKGILDYSFLGENADSLITLISALSGAIVGGLFTLLVGNRQAKIAEKNKEKELLEIQRSVLKGIRGEMSILLELYDKRMKKHVEAIVPGEMLLVTFPIGDDNFTFYEENAKEIAKLSDDSRDSIIEIYTYARSLIQSYKGNNKLISEYEHIFLLMAEKTENEIYQKLYEAKRDSLIVYAQGIKLIDSEVREVKDKGFKVIDQEVSRIESLIK